MKPPIRFISLGWGVQSWTLAAMSALGQLPKADYAIHADTQHEASGTYAHAAKWTPWLKERGIEVVTLKGPRTNVVEAAWSNSVMIPAFSVAAKDGKRGQIMRQCTTEWKIRPIRRFLRSKVTALPPGAIESWLGISTEEMTRMRTSDVVYIRNVYPLVDLGMSRNDCAVWLQAHGLDVPPKSACVFCPYRKPAQWQAVKNADGDDWRHALAVDAAIRHKRGGFGELFIHPARVPLADAVKEPDGAQLALETEAPCDGGVCFV